MVKRILIFDDVESQLEGATWWQIKPVSPGSTRRRLYIDVNKNDYTLTIHPPKVKAGAVAEFYIPAIFTTKAPDSINAAVVVDTTFNHQKSGAPARHNGPIGNGGTITYIGITKINFVIEDCWIEYRDELTGDTPASAISVEAYAPRADESATIIDRSRLDMSALDFGTPPRQSFVLDTSTLNWGSRLLPPGQDRAWRDLLTPTTSIQTRRGVTAEGPALVADVGVMTIEALDGLDPRALGLTVGTPVRAYHIETGAMIFQGEISDARVIPEPAQSRYGYRSQIVVVDRVAQIAAYTRHGARSSSPDGSDTWDNRALRYTRSLPRLPWKIQGTSSLNLPPTVWETSLAAHLDALTMSIGGVWYVDRDNRPVIAASRPSLPLSLVTVSDIPQPDHSMTLYYADAAESWQASNVVASVAATTHPAKVDDNGEWTADDVTLTVTDPTAAASWTGRTITVDMLTWPGPDTDRAARRLLNAAGEAPPLLESVEIPVMAPAGGIQNRVKDVVALDVMEPIKQVARGEKSTALLAWIEHEITPTTWHTRLGFA